MTQFSWKKAQKRQVLRLKKRIKQCEKIANGDNTMDAKKRLQQLERRMQDG